MKKTISILATIIFAYSFISCNDFLDTTPKDKVSDRVIWSDVGRATLYLNYFYKYIDDYGNFGTAQFSSGTLTEGLTETFKYGGYAAGARGGDANNYVFTPELMTPAGTLLGTWSTSYEAIRRINEYLEGQKLYSKLDDDQNAVLEAQARFFRAFVYFQLAKRHGSVIIYRDMNLSRNKDRSPASEVWNFIAEDLNFAAGNLPTEWNKANQGRVTKGAAYAMLSRAMLYAERWTDVVEAANKVFEQNLYSLESDYAKSTKGGNAESILEYSYLLTGPNHSYDKYYATYGESQNTGGMGVPTQEMVEQYEKKGGGVVDWSTWHTERGTTVRPPYEDLEPRFHASIIYNGSKWKGNVMENSVDGSHGRYMDYRTQPYTQGHTVTGYYLKKHMDESNLTVANIKSTQTWVELRLAEVYLNRAEANYQLKKTAEALDDLNEIRKRVGLNNLEGISGDKLFDAIRQERKIELFVEGHLYWDMRRWKLAHVEYNNYRVHGMKISKSATGWLYEYVDCDLQDRRFLQKTYVLPIPSQEILNNTAIQQFDEWK